MDAAATGELSPKLGKFLKKWRNAVGLSQGDVSKECGYSTSQFISNWERNKSKPPPEAWPVIIRKYKISQVELFQIMLEDITDEAHHNLTKQFAQF